MTKRKTVKRLEALIDALEDSKPSCDHNIVEINLVVDQIIYYQCEYKKITDRYYSIKRRVENHERA